MILVTGGTGFLGAHLVYQLSQKQDAVRVLYRSADRFEQVRQVFSFYTDQVEALFQRIEWVQGDITDIYRLNEIMQGVDVVYHLAGLINFEWRQLDRLKKTNIEGTANIVNAALAHNIKKLCYVSSIAAMSTSPQDSDLEESLEPIGVFEDPYALTKYCGEKEVWRGQQEGLDVLIVRPGVILGEGFWYSGSGKLIKHAAKNPLFYPSGATGFIDVRDVAQQSIALMDGPIKNKAFVFVGHNASFRSILDALCVLFEQPKPKFQAPKMLLQCMSMIDFLWAGLFKRSQKLPKAYVLAMFRQSIYDTETLPGVTHLPFRALKDTLARICALSPYKT
jgi:dihydroflavonol-4-reductase